MWNISFVNTHLFIKEFFDNVVYIYPYQKEFPHSAYAEVFRRVLMTFGCIRMYALNGKIRGMHTKPERSVEVIEEEVAL